MAKRRARKRAATNAGDHPCGKCHKPVKAVAKCEKCGADFHPGCALSYVKANSARECCTQAFRNLGKNAKIAGSPSNARKVQRIRKLSSSVEDSRPDSEDSSSPAVRETRLRKTAAAV